MPEMYHPNLPVSRDGPIATVTFDRPQQRNAFTRAMWDGLAATLQALSADASLRCVILRGAGDQAFSSGADIKAFDTERGSYEAECAYAGSFSAGMQAIRACQHPVVAAIEGYCIGGGAGIATMADFRVGDSAIKFGITARNLSLYYSYAEMDPVIAMVGSAVAAEIFIEGRIFSGREAYEKGLLSRLVADGTVQAEARALADRIAEGAPLSARFHKTAIRRLRGPLPMTPAEELAVNRFADTEDFRAAVQAFREKRKPVWKGR